MNNSTAIIEEKEEKNNDVDSVPSTWIESLSKKYTIRRILHEMYSWIRRISFSTLKQCSRQVYMIIMVNSNTPQSVTK